jgi:hypothetical protein
LKVTCLQRGYVSPTTNHSVGILAPRPTILWVC